MLRNREFRQFAILFALMVRRICCAWLCNQYGGGTAFIIFLRCLRRSIFCVYQNPV